MGRIAVLGATGFTGRLVVDALSATGHDLVLAARDPGRLDATLDAERRAVDVTDDPALRALCRDVDVLVTTVGPFERLGRSVLAAAIEERCHYLDSTGEQPFVRWAYDGWDDVARRNGVTAVPAAGFDFVPGDLLAAVAARDLTDPSEVHVTYGVLGAHGILGGLVPGLSAGTRETVASMLGRSSLAYVDGHLTEEQVAEARRLAWFPRPLGPRHAAGYPGAEPLSVPRHVPGLDVVRTYLALPTMLAEGVQLAGNAARWEPARRVLSRVVRTQREGPTAEQRHDTRWAVVAEARGAEGVVRAWANGRDVYGFTAESMAHLAESLASGDVICRGVVAPAMVADPASTLDALAARAGIRWAVIRP